MQPCRRDYFPFQHFSNHIREINVSLSFSNIHFNFYSNAWYHFRSMLNSISTSHTQRDSRERLLVAAREVFAKRGYDGATVKELADAAGVNISLVSYYFGGKEGLYKSCIEEAGRDRLAVAERILKKPESIEDFRVRLTLFVEEFFAYHLREKNLCTILSRECLSDNPNTRELFRDTFLKAGEKLRDFFAAAQKSGLLRQDFDPFVLNYLFFGAIKSAVQFKTTTRQYYGTSLEDPVFRESVIRHAVHLVMGF